MFIVLRWMLMIAGGVSIARWLASRRTRHEAPDPLSLIEIPNTTVSAMRIEDDAIALHWTIPGRQVQIYRASSFSALDQAPLTASAEGVDELVIRDVPPHERSYFRLVFDGIREEYIAEREIPFEGIVNFRDVGGYPAADGRTVRWDRLYRGASLAEASPADLRWLEDHGLRLVCDLRTDEEVMEAPDRLPAGTQFLRLPAQSHDNRLVQMARLMLIPDSIEQMIPDLYTRVLIDGNKAMFASILRQIASADQLPLMIHCTAGKDRTGIAIALVLSLLGVPRSIILADYSLSNAHYAYFQRVSQTVLRQLNAFGIHEADTIPLLSANPATLDATLTHIDRTYGSVEQYLRISGLTDAELNAIRENLLSP